MKPSRVFLFSSLALVAAPALALDNADQVGTRLTAAAAPAAQRTINIDQRTRYVNVDYGETILFLVNGPSGQKSELWRFDGLASRFPFTQVSTDAPVKTLQVYVNQGPNPLNQIPNDE